AKHVALRWNPNGLVQKKIIINKLQIEKANVDTIKTLVASFSKDDSNESNESSSSDSLGIKVDVGQVFVSLEPFVEQGISISSTVLDANGIAYTEESIAVDALAFGIDSNVTDIFLDASLKEGQVDIKELNITKVDVLALKTLFMPDGNESNISDANDTVVVAENNATNDEPLNPLVPKSVYLEKLEISILPLVYDPVDMKHLHLSGKDALFDVENLVLQKANLDLHSRTNLSDVYYTTKVKNNKLIGRVDFKPKKDLFELYQLPVRSEAVGDIVLDLNVSEEEVVTDLKISMEQILKGGKDEFNLDIDSLHSHAVYNIKEGTLQADSKVLLTTPYAKDVLVTNHFTMDKKIAYSGEVQAKQIIGVDAKFVTPLNNLKVSYEGDDHSIKTEIDADNLQGTFISEDFKKALLHLQNKETLVLNEFIELPEELNGTKANIVIDAPLSFEENATMTAIAKIESNVVNMDTNISYKKKLNVKSITHIPEESLLRAYSEDVKWDRLNPVKSKVTFAGNTIEAKLNAGPLDVNTKYDLNSTNVEGTVKLGGLNGNVSGKLEEKMSVDTKISSIDTLIESIKEVYTLGDVPVVKGSGDISLGLTEMKKVEMRLRSPQIIYQADHKTEHIVNDIDLTMNLEDKKVVLDRYTLTYADQKLFSTKPSTVMLDDTTLTISPLWLNDELKVEGKYDLKTRKGTIDANADKLHIAHEIIDLDNKIDIKTVLDGNKTSVNGEIILLGGDIHYDLAQKTYASDSDIIIVQDMKEKEATPFMDNLSVAVQIKTKKPLVYNKGNVNIQAAVDLSIYKASGSELMVLGSVEILQGGTYTFEGKKFVLDKSYVHFTGNPNKPLIEASVKYKSLNHLITIMVTGSANTPNINFSSKPTLTKEQILSIILFDSEEGAGTNSGEDMMKMMGGAMAKSALSNLGVQLDYLAFGEGSSVEVGKKLTDDITIIYVNDEVSAVKLKYRHGKRTESVIGVSEESQSYDIIYKKDF
ncbi:MAG TPA: translocation/assembly module TamB domain-containing protein, partial [Sulfurovum sp.]